MNHVLWWWSVGISGDVPRLITKFLNCDQLFFGCLRSGKFISAYNFLAQQLLASSGNKRKLTVFLKPAGSAQSAKAKSGR